MEQLKKPVFVGSIVDSESGLDDLNKFAEDISENGDCIENMAVQNFNRKTFYEKLESRVQEFNNSTLSEKAQVQIKLDQKWAEEARQEELKDFKKAFIYLIYESKNLKRHHIETIFKEFGKEGILQLGRELFVRTQKSSFLHLTRWPIWFLTAAFDNYLIIKVIGVDLGLVLLAAGLWVVTGLIGFLFLWALCHSEIPAGIAEMLGVKLEKWRKARVFRKLWKKWSKTYGREDYIFESINWIDLKQYE